MASCNVDFENIPLKKRIAHLAVCPDHILDELLGKEGLQDSGMYLPLILLRNDDVINTVDIGMNIKKVKLETLVANIKRSISFNKSNNSCSKAGKIVKCFTEKSRLIKHNFFRTNENIIGKYEIKQLDD